MDILKHVKTMQIPYFRGVFMRDALPRRANNIESIILNHDSIKNHGTHWTALIKVGSKAYYFDSFGKLPPPLELVSYVGPKTEILYNYGRYQEFNSKICGHLALQFLHDFWRRNNEINID